MPQSVSGEEEPLGDEEEKLHHSIHIDALSELSVTMNLVIEAASPLKNDTSLAIWEPMKHSQFLFLYPGTPACLLVMISCSISLCLRPCLYHRR